MSKDLIKEVLANSKFVDELLELNTGEELKYALKDKGIILKEDDLGLFCKILADALKKRISARNLASVSGGKSLKENKIHIYPEIEQKIENWFGKKIDIH